MDKLRKASKESEVTTHPSGGGKVSKVKQLNGSILIVIYLHREFENEFNK